MSRSPDEHPEQRTRVTLVAVGVVTVALVLRGWALYPSWFYLDDLQMLDDAARTGLGTDLLLTPYDSQLMPVGRFLAWVVTTGGLVDWPLAATLTLALQLAASACCWWMVTTLVGVRWGALAPLTLYLASAMTLPAFMWWAASLNALPLQVCFFAAVAAWVRYLRGQGRRWLAVTLLVLVVALASYVKALVLFPVLAVLTLGWFVPGSPRDRVVSAARRWWPALVLGVGLATAYLTYYLVTVPQLTTDSTSSSDVAVPLAGTMLGRSLPLGLVGGPWTWSRINPPVGVVDAPGWALMLSWVVLLGLAAYLAATRVRTGRVWLLLGGSAALSYALLLVTRAPVVGSIAGLEYRYLSDVTCAAVLTLALLTMPLREGEGGTEPRADPLIALPTRRVGVVLTVALALSGTVSAVGYARIWHEDNPGRDYLRATQDSLRDGGPQDFADTVVPDDVMPGFLFPFNTTPRLLPLVVDDVSFPQVTDDLLTLAPDGAARRAFLDPATRSEPGPDGACGWRVGTGPVSIPVRRTTLDFTWWLRLGYLSSGEASMTVAAAGETAEVPVRSGLHSLFIEVEGPVSSVDLSDLTPGTTVCVDVVEVGTVQPGGPL
ncbi:hypothetical protein ENKNEFLB_03144 [Nocardioides aquaticus]|uniref:Glycosyltransferase RgtA/B/C/D-like domain-containing protein n=1 Tax=Nocardioides aquaticus TaxID=160826 RepID=A0ABX8EJQ0_9ACTN|nr:hypothetical protein [Nocardioides aquaticus]QVT80744.1 hypothetical protein ENKNEFLB_03144 [Nocardioides aquaticus]